MQREFTRFNLVLCDSITKKTLEITPTLVEEIKEAQAQDSEIQDIKELIQRGKAESFHLDEQGVLWLKDRICVPDQNNLRQQIL